MDDEDEDFTPWTPEGAALLLESADALVEAIRTHASAITSLRGDEQSGEVFAAGDRLRRAVRAYADAQFEYTGTGFPLGIVHEFDEDEGEDVIDIGPVAGVSVLRRNDYVVTNEAAVMKAGRKAYRRLWPAEDAAAAAADVTHLGRALYQIAHAEGWDSLEQVKGLQPVGGVVVVQSSDELLSADPDEWPEDNLFRHDDDRLLYRQDDVYSG
ncbi:hypothetical protein TESS_TESS_02551 [Tessaracoccus sp. O5.2]|uniref:hypothetical protein n=1 Tax=Tessaracoccus sp. O5.2 TaxID=3157622 RepID=UPI0035E66F04